MLINIFFMPVEEYCKEKNPPPLQAVYIRLNYKEIMCICQHNTSSSSSYYKICMFFEFITQNVLVT